MKVHFFEVAIENSSEDPTSVIDRIRRMPLAERDIAVNEKYMVLETSNVAGEQGDMRELDFTQRRVQNGPGHSRRGQPTADFDLGQDAGFGEQTAAILSPGRYMAVQYNHYGVRSSAIGTYLSHFLRNGAFVNLKPVLTDDAFARLQRSSVQTRLEFAFNASEITESMASQVGIAQALALRSATGAGHINISLSLGEGRRGGPLRDVVPAISRINGQPGVTALKVAMKENIDAKTEVLDLLKQRETVIIPDNRLEMTGGRRFTYESRMDALRREFELWIQRR